jgi:hypothetical protein
MHTATNLKILTAKAWLNRLPFNSKKSDLQSVNKTLMLLSDYHALPMSHPIFLKQYKHLIQLQTLLQKEN